MEIFVIKYFCLLWKYYILATNCPAVNFCYTLSNYVFIYYSTYRLLSYLIMPNCLVQNRLMSLIIDQYDNLKLTSSCVRFFTFVLPHVLLILFIDYSFCWAIWTKNCFCFVFTMNKLQPSHPMHKAYTSDNKNNLYS